nr:hypothetical protein [Mycolicibacterium conceptionense]
MIVHSLLGDAFVGHQTAAVTHRRPQRIDCCLFNMAAARSLASQIGQCRAIAIIGLEPARSQLDSGRLRL